MISTDLDLCFITYLGLSMSRVRENIDGELIVNDFNGFRFVFSPDDGTFVKRIQSLRPW